MGREIRRVPANWEHPTTDHYGNGRFQPLHNRDYEKAARQWVADFLAWSRGEHESQKTSDIAKGCEFFWEWGGNPPDPEYYVPYDPDALTDEAWWQMYETVSEGTPVSPPFATRAELVNYLVENGDFLDQRRGRGGWNRHHAEEFVERGWAPSLVTVGHQVFEPRDGMPE